MSSRRGQASLVPVRSRRRHWKTAVCPRHFPHHSLPASLSTSLFTYLRASRNTVHPTKDTQHSTHDGLGRGWPAAPRRPSAALASRTHNRAEHRRVLVQPLQLAQATCSRPTPPAYVLPRDFWLLAVLVLPNPTPTVPTQERGGKNGYLDQGGPHRRHRGHNK